MVENAKKYFKRIQSFLGDAYSEFKKVAWPSKKQTIRLTGFVLGVSLGVALYVWGIDVGLTELLSSLILLR